MIKNKKEFFGVFCPQLPFTPIINSIISQAEYWFSKKENGFYKFVEPSDHYLYKEGDSWTEEVGCVRKTFNKAFDIIGVRYKSKSAFLLETNPFKGKLYASYHDRKTGKTYYFRNHALIDQVMKQLNPLKKETSDLKKFDQPAVTVTVKKTRSSNIDTKTTKHITPLSPKAADAAGDEEIKKLIFIWNDRTGQKATLSCFRKREQKNLLNFFSETCKGKFELWKKFCDAVGEDRVLSGKISSFGWKATLPWLSKKSNIEKILNGSYSLDFNKITHMTPSKEDCLKPIVETFSQSSDKQTAGIFERMMTMLMDKIGAPSFSSWFSDLAPETTDDNVLILKAPSKFKSDYLNMYFYDKLRSILAIERGFDDVIFTY